MTRDQVIPKGGGILLLLLWSSVLDAAPERFARLVAAPPRVYSGQVFDLSLSIHSTGMPLDKSISIAGLASPGLARIGDFEELPMTRETLDGNAYDIRNFRARVTAGPAGNHRLAPNLGGTVIEEVRSYFFVQRHLRPVAIPVEPLTLPVLPLPEERRPPSFSGAVGEFLLYAAATPLNVAPGDLVTVEIRIEGLGFPETAAVPAVSAVAGLKTYEVRPVPGESRDFLRVFRQTVVPSDPLLAGIPALNFTFFNSRTGQYETQSAGPFPLRFHAEPVAVQPVYTGGRTTNSPAIPPPAGAAEPERRGSFWTRWLHRLRGDTVELLHVAGAPEVRVAPGDQAAVLFRLRPGSVVRIVARWEGWLRVEAPEGAGWLRSTPP